MLVKAGTIVDATIIAAPSATKNATGTRDPEMRQTRKGKQWYFGMKLHIDTDTHGLVHHVTATAASVADITELPKLLHGTEDVLFGDQAYWKADHREQWQAEGGRYRVNPARDQEASRSPALWSWRRTGSRCAAHAW